MRNLTLRCANGAGNDVATFARLGRPLDWRVFNFGGSEIEPPNVTTATFGGSWRIVCFARRHFAGAICPARAAQRRVDELGAEQPIRSRFLRVATNCANWPPPPPDRLEVLTSRVELLVSLSLRVRYWQPQVAAE